MIPRGRPRISNLRAVRPGSVIFFVMKSRDARTRLQIIKKRCERTLENQHPPFSRPCRQPATQKILKCIFDATCSVARARRRIKSSVAFVCGFSRAAVEILDRRESAGFYMALFKGIEVTRCHATHALRANAARLARRSRALARIRRHSRDAASAPQP